MNQKSAIIDDFTRKQKEYYHSNYVLESKQNLLRRLRRKLISDAAQNGNTKGEILDFGCGPAILYGELLSTCSRYLAIDLVPANIEQIRDDFSHERMECRVGDIEVSSLSDEFFDIIICSGSLEYTCDPLGNLFRLAGLLRPGGRIIASLPQRSSPYRLWSEYAYTPIRQLIRNRQGTSVSSYSRTLVSTKSIRKRFAPPIYRIEIAYLGYKLLLQPFDAIFSSCDAAIMRLMQSNAPGWLHWASIEVVVTVSRHE